MLLKSLEIAMLLTFIVLVISRYLTAVTFEVGYDEFILMGLAFSVGMLIRDWIGK